MKKVEAIIQPFKLDEVREILAKSKIPRIAIFEVKGAGCQQGRLKQYWGARYIEDSVDVKIEILVDDDEAEPLAEMGRPSRAGLGARRCTILCDAKYDRF